VAFNRLIEVVIGSTAGTGKKISQSRIRFSVDKTDNKSANESIIEIWNLSDATANLAKTNYKIILRAGYEDEGGLKNLFFGDIKEAIQKKEGTDKILKISAYDGYTNIQNKTISLSYKAGTSIQQIFNDFTSVFGLPITNKNLVLTGNYANGYAYVGKVKQGITEILNYAGKQWSIQNNQIIVYSPGEFIQTTGLKLSPNTGLIGTPEPISNSDDQQTEGQTIPKRWKIKSLLFPQLFPGVKIRINSEKVNGYFRIETSKSLGNNWEGDFTCEMEVVEI